MPAMNVGIQRRLGKLPKTPDMLTYSGHTYGNTHRGYMGRRPTPTSEGFFGLGSAAGDGKLHYFGDGPGQADLPMHGFYGFGSAELEYQAANMLIDGGVSHNPTHNDTPGMYGNVLTDSYVANVPNWMIGAGAIGLIYYYKRR